MKRPRLNRGPFLCAEMDRHSYDCAGQSVPQFLLVSRADNRPAGADRDLTLRPLLHYRIFAGNRLILAPE